MGGVFSRPTEGGLAMLTHGKGPKDILVGSYARWINGQRYPVRHYLKGMTHKLSDRGSDSQMDFGFW
jgi:hypothetical protein